MHFSRHTHEDPEINLIPFIDVLLVILIFLMLSTTYSKFTELQVTLPTANAEPAKDRPAEIIVGVTADGRYVVDRTPVEGRNVEQLAAALATAANTQKDPVIIISADATVAHQAVINVLDAARRANLQRILFASQQAQTGAAR